MIENVTNLSSTPALSDPSGISKIDFTYIFALIVGAFIAGVVGIIVARVNQRFEVEDIKRWTSKVFLSEVKANQDRLQPLSDSLAKVLESDTKVLEEDSIENTSLPNELNFDRTIYSSLADKIGLLDDESIEKMVQYYVKIKIVEEQYKKLELIYGTSPSSLIRIRDIEELKKATGRFNYDNNSPEWDEIEEFLRNAEKAYNLGKELIKSLNCEVGRLGLRKTIMRVNRRSEQVA